MSPRYSALLLTFAFAASLGQAAAPAPLTRIEKEDFGKTPEGQTVERYTLRNAKGMSARIITYGAIITELQVPDRDGKTVSVVRGNDSFDRYRNYAFTARTIGRVANRIAGASFTLDGKDYKLAANSGPNTIHGGRQGFGDRLWTAKPLPPADHQSAVTFTYVSKDGEEGFPGNLTLDVTFSLTDNNEFRLDYRATTDKPTPVNFTNHAFFNLAGPASTSALDHELWIDADKYTVANDQLIPTGEIAPVKGTFLDFTTPAKIGARIAQIPVMATYDHSYVLNSGGKSPPALALVARVTEPTSGRIMEVRTDQPGMQLYTVRGPQHPALCLETQHYPDSVHHPDFPNTILHPGEAFTSTTIYAFSNK